MKLTKEQLKRMIKEEIALSINEVEDYTDQNLISSVREVIESMKRNYDQIPEDQSDMQERFEDLLQQNVDLYKKEWEKQRADHKKTQNQDWDAEEHEELEL